MREILFRGKSELGNVWRYGNYVCTVDDFGNSSGKIIKSTGEKCEVILETVGQYTGLTDKNGVNIFEGDFIEAGYSKWKTKVVWDDKSAKFIGLTNDKEYKFVYVDMVDKNGKSAVEVIGNIFDNP